MPEIPDLEAIREFFNERIVGDEITSAEALIPYVMRTGAADFAATLTGNRFGDDAAAAASSCCSARRRAQVMVINPMLTGRFQYVRAEARRSTRRPCLC